MKFTVKETYILELDFGEMDSLLEIFKIAGFDNWKPVSGRKEAKELIENIKITYEESKYNT